jgi:hypothetical protein
MIDAISFSHSMTLLHLVQPSLSLPLLPAVPSRAPSSHQHGRLEQNFRANMSNVVKRQTLYEEQGILLIKGSI